MPALLSILTAAALAAPSPTAAPADTTKRPVVAYRIEAALDETTDVLHGRARLHYTNRSGVALDTLWFHQHLNAFRPHSAWARRELEYGERRFSDLGPEEHAYERFRSVEVGGRAVRPVYPGAPDSTVVGIPLPTPLQSGETAVLVLDWDARLATLPRRQGRAGRHYDWAQWYPRIAVYENGAWQTQPLLPQGEFYGEFASYDVTLDVTQDQVIGATGVPVEGDPGWRLASGAEPAYRRDAYPPRAAEPLGLLDGAAVADRKRVRWRAEAVHHFGWSNDPAYRYEQGAVGDIPIHVLYQAVNDTAWSGVAVQRTERALGWLQRLFGPYPWPQFTNVNRLESGGTEFPMLIMDGSASEGLIVHEATHQYLHGALANNEWREGWLDEGFTSFVGDWYAEDHGAENVWTRALDGLARLERAGRAEPLSLASADFSSPGAYSAMTYTKPAVVFYMLREMVGDETMRRILRTYYERHKLSHVGEADFRAAVNEVTGTDYGWFFDQWIHTTDTLDYGVGEVSTRRLADGRWQTRVQVLRLGRAWMPVVLQVGGERRTLDSRERAQTVEVVTATRPAEVVLDPDRVLLDIDPTNNRKAVR